ncbi:hypothetical protein LINPERHAP2_LOCUS34433 [Linum perenne]
MRFKRFESMLSMVHVHKTCFVIFLKSHVGKASFEVAIKRIKNTEKQARLVGDVVETTKYVTEIPQLCFDAKDWKALNDKILSLSKNYGKLK